MEHNYIIPFDIVNTMVMNHHKIILARVCASACCNLSQITDIITLCFPTDFDTPLSYYLKGHQ
jgi:hypothetical protein